mgnify:CR=1 FL=1
MQGGPQQMPQQASNPFGGLQSQMPQQMANQQMPPMGMQGSPAMPAMGQNPLSMQGGAPQGSMPYPAEQDGAMQRLLAEIRARQGGAQPQQNNLQSMLGL